MQKELLPGFAHPLDPKRNYLLQNTQLRKNNKRRNSQSDNDTDSSEDPDPKPKRGPKKEPKCQRIEASDTESAEIVDQAEPEAVVEEVEDNPDLSDDEVSAIPSDRDVGLTL